MVSQGQLVKGLDTDSVSKVKGEGVDNFASFDF